MSTVSPGGPIGGEEPMPAPWTAVADYVVAGGWGDRPDALDRARRWCERLEAGEILYFATPPFALPEADRAHLLGQHWGGSAIHKNISYRPGTGVLGGFRGDAGARAEIHRVLRDYSAHVLAFLARFLLPYAGRFAVDYASFRPVEEEGRDLPLHKRNDLLHVDAFPSRPTRGGRILRIFTNLHPERARVWLVTDRFPALAERFAADAGLPRYARPLPAPARLAARVKGLVGFPGAGRSAYDRFMLRFHDFLKEHAAFQAGCAKTRIEFPPLATWLVFTDCVPHAVLSGRHALEQTVIVPTDALVAPQHAPIRVLERLAGVPLDR
jgi:hypothetical protein